MSDPTPLPESLLTCGCRLAKLGRHSTSCKPARDHEALPLKERPGYEEGRPYRCVSWDYPLTIELQVRVSIEVDPVAYIRQHRDAYEAFELEGGYEEWEKPIAFLAKSVEDDADGFDMASFGYPRMVSSVRIDADDFSEHPRWDEDATDALLAALGPRVDPNQGVLL